MINSCRESSLAALGTAYWNTRNDTRRNEIAIFLQDSFGASVRDAYAVAARYVNFLGEDENDPNRRSNFDESTPQEGRDIFGVKYNTAVDSSLSSLVCPAEAADAPVFMVSNLDECHKAPLVRLAQLYTASHPLSGARSAYFQENQRLISEWMHFDATLAAPLAEREVVFRAIAALVADSGPLNSAAGSVTFETEMATRRFRACPAWVRPEVPETASATARLRDAQAQAATARLRDAQAQAATARLRDAQAATARLRDAQAAEARLRDAQAQATNLATEAARVAEAEVARLTALAAAASREAEKTSQWQAPAVIGASLLALFLLLRK